MKRILIAEDDICVSRVLSRVFARGGYDTLVANNGERALELLAVNPTVDVLITDINMPRLDGRELCRQLQDEGPYLPRITYVVTARMSHEERSWVDGLPGVELLEKPISPKALYQRVERKMSQTNGKSERNGAA